MHRLFALRDARLYLAGQAFSLFGDTALFLVLAIWVKSLTGSNGAAGLTFFFLALPGLFAPLAGLVVDRVKRRPLMIFTDLFLGAAVLLLLLVHSRGQVWLIYLVALLYGFGGIVFFSAQSALLTVILPKDLLGEGNGFLQTIREGFRLFAPLLGAGLYAAFGGGVVAVLDAITFGISAVCLLGLHVQETVFPRVEQRFRTELAAGVRYVMKTIALRQIVLTTGVALLVVGFTETLAFAVLSRGLHKPPAFFGVLSTFQGVGAIAGGLTAAKVLRRLGDARVLGLGLALFGVGCAGLMGSSLPLVLLGLAVAGSGLPWAIVAFGTAIQTRTPPELQGRVYSAADTIVGLPQTISIAVGAALATFIDYRILLMVITTVLAACCLYLFTRKMQDVTEFAVPGTPQQEAVLAGQMPPEI